MRMDFGMVHKGIQLLINMHQSRCKCSKRLSENPEIDCINDRISQNEKLKRRT